MSSLPHMLILFHMPVVCLLTVDIVVTVCGPLTELLARTRPAVPLATAG